MEKSYFAVAAAPLLWLGVAAAGAGAAYYGYKAYKSVSRIEANAKQQARNTAFRLAIRTAGWGKIIIIITNRKTVLL